MQRFSDAGQDALLPCDRSSCSTYLSDYDTNSFHCTSSCFNASCDWSRATCAPQKAVIASCPFFDAAVLLSVRNQQKQRKMFFASGGSCRFVNILSVHNRHLSLLAIYELIAVHVQWIRKVRLCWLQECFICGF